MRITQILRYLFGRRAVPMIAAGQHWQLRGVNFYRFFAALPELVPVKGLLVLASSSPSAELRDFYVHNARAAQPAVTSHLQPEFCDGVFLPITSPLMSAFTDLVNHHSEPEVAIFLAVADEERILLEWFDAPNDPLAIAASLGEERVRRFASATGASYKWVPGG